MSAVLLRFLHCKVCAFRYCCCCSSFSHYVSPSAIFIFAHLYSYICRAAMSHAQQYTVESKTYAASGSCSSSHKCAFQIYGILNVRSMRKRKRKSIRCRDQNKIPSRFVYMAQLLEQHICLCSAHVHIHSVSFCGIIQLLLIHSCLVCSRSRA